MAARQRETGAPLDPLTWADGGIRTTYPACMAVRAAAEQGEAAAVGYLRRLREGIMCERLKLDHSEALVEAARPAGLDLERFRLALRSHAITEAFGADLEATAALAAERGDPPRSSAARGGAALPTAVFTGEAGREVVRPAADRRLPATPPHCGRRPAGPREVRVRLLTGREDAIFPARVRRLTTRAWSAQC